MAKLFGVDMAKLIHQSLSKGLISGKLYSASGAARDPLNPTAGLQGATGVTHTFKGVVQFYRDNEVDNELVLKEDRKILIIANSLSPTITPAKGMRIEMSDTPDVYHIVRVNRDPATATYLCQGRL